MRLAMRAAVPRATPSSAARRLALAASVPAATRAIAWNQTGSGVLDFSKMVPLVGDS